MNQGYDCGLFLTWSFVNPLNFTKQSNILTFSRKKAFENSVGKGENADHSIPSCSP